jgi:CheY-like chemotaxis protein
MRFHWIEKNGPLVHAPLRHGFGTTLIEKGLKAHGGEAVIQYEPEGLICQITLPLPKATQPGLPLSLSLNGHGVTTDKHSIGHLHLKGKRILVIEDEPLVSIDIEACLTESGSFVVGPAANLDRARRLIETETFDGALVDANLGGEPVDDLAHALTRKGIPFIFLTGYGRDSLPEAFRDSSMIGKPYTRESLIASTGKMMKPRES